MEGRIPEKIETAGCPHPTGARLRQNDERAVTTARPDQVTVRERVWLDVERLKNELTATGGA